MSEQQEIALSRQQHHQSALQQYQVYDHPRLPACAATGTKIASRSHRRHLNFTLPCRTPPRSTLLPCPVDTSMSLGASWLNMNNEEQLAGVPGHEIGHVTARHGVRQHRNQTVTSIGGLLIAAATGSQQITPDHLSGYRGRDDYEYRSVDRRRINGAVPRPKIWQFTKWPSH